MASKHTANSQPSPSAVLTIPVLATALVVGSPPPPAINTLPPWLPGSEWTQGTSRQSFPTLAAFPRPISVLYDRAVRPQTRRFGHKMSWRYFDRINRILLISLNPVNLVNPVEFSVLQPRARQVLERTNFLALWFSP